MRITLEDIFNLSTAVIYNPDLYKSVTSVSIDTRTIKRNSLFVAIKGKNFDGHNYIKDAVKKGATAIVVSNRKLNTLDNINIPVISVRNTKTAYGELANIWRKKLKAKVISITGSNGKTSTKEITKQLLSAKYKVHSTYSNNNNEIGVPLTILTAPKNTEVVVLEHGSNHFGEIEYTAKIAQPDLALITNIGNSHIEFLKNEKGVLKEKIALFNNIKSDGKILINNDDKLLSIIKQNYKNKVTYGFTGKVDVKGKRLGFTDDGYGKLEVKYKKGKLEITLPLLGESNTINYLSSVAIATELGLTKKQIIDTTKKIKQIPKRLEKKEFKEFTIIDDTYNSNPESVRNALLVLKQNKIRKNKIVIIGDMFELGNVAKKKHLDLAKEINKAKINTVLTIGKNSKYINESLNKNVSIKKHFATRKLLKNYIGKLELNDSIILVKGSRGMRMEEFVEILEKRAV
jgi:UDP-N-acetylmuramoyl-tripeptide--D-alanyl-D-alanine ligase